MRLTCISCSETLTSLWDGLEKFLPHDGLMQFFLFFYKWGGVWVLGSGGVGQGAVCKCVPSLNWTTRQHYLRLLLGGLFVCINEVRPCPLTNGILMIRNSQAFSLCLSCQTGVTRHERRAWLYMVRSRNRNQLWATQNVWQSFVTPVNIS